MYRTVDTSIWDDPRVRRLDASGKLLWLYCITNRHTHVSGAFYLPVETAALETGTPVAETQRALDTLSALGLIRYDPDRRVIWVVRFFRHQGRGAKNARAAAKQLETLHGSPLIAEFLDVYGEVQPFMGQRVARKREGIPASLRYRILERDGYACRYCGASAPDAALEVDHVVPVAQGGVSDESNLVASCADCNKGKSDRVSQVGPQDQEQEQEQETPPTPPQGGSAPNPPKPKRRAGTIGPQDQAARDLAAALGSSLNPCRKQVAALVAAGRTIEQIRDSIRQHAEPGLAPWEWTKRVTGGSKPRERDQLIPRAKPPTIEDYAASMGVTVEVARERLGKAEPAP